MPSRPLDETAKSAEGSTGCEGTIPFLGSFQHAIGRPSLRSREMMGASASSKRPGASSMVDQQAGQCGRERRAHTFIHQSGEDLVLLEPVGHLAPGCLGSFLAVARPVVGMEAVRRAWIGLEVGGLFGTGE